MRIPVVASVLFAALVATGCPRTIDASADAGPGADGGIVACVDDEQCSGGFCLNGICSDAQCATKATCSTNEVCIQGHCTAPPATCESSEDCPGALVCDGFSNSCFDPNHPGGEGEGEGGAGEGEGEGGAGGEGEGEGGAGEGEGEGASLDLSGYALENRQNNPVNQAAVFPGGTVVFAGHTVVIGREATKSEFEAHWGTLPNTCLYLQGPGGGNGIPIVNGGEIWALVDPNGSVVDGPTIAGDTSKSYHRTNAGSAGSANNWNIGTDAEADPGVTQLPAHTGLKISEWSDASGNSNFVFEFIELSYQP